MDQDTRSIERGRAEAGAPEGQGQEVGKASRKLVVDDPKKLVIYSEIMKPKYLE